jgi:hypothetical protein
MSLERRSDMAKNPNIDDDTRKRALAFVEKNKKGMDSEGFDSREYRSDPYGKMTKAERDARKGYVTLKRYPDDFPPAVVDDATKRLPPKKQSFKEAFAAARKAGGKIFEWNGKKYTTELAKPTAKTMTKEEAAKNLKLGEKVSSTEVDKAKKQLGMAKGGMANCGASVPPAQKRK